MFDAAKSLFLTQMNHFNTKKRTFAVRNKSKNWKIKTPDLL